MELIITLARRNILFYQSVYTEVSKMWQTRQESVNESVGECVCTPPSSGLPVPKHQET